MSPKTIILLVGPKGSGKTYLASRMEAELGIGFVRVEPIWLSLSAEISPGTAQFDEEGQSRVISAAHEALEHHSTIVLESTGTAPWFPRQKSDLDAIGSLIFVKVDAPLSLCLERIQHRDASNHIPVSDDRVNEINAIASRVVLPWTIIVPNTNSDHADEFIEMMRERFGGRI